MILSRPRIASVWSFSLLGVLLLGSRPVLAAVDAIDMSLDELMQVRLLSTPKFNENPDEVPAAVSILTVEDIRAFGWRTLADALRSLQGFNVTNDHTYRYTGVRGASSPGDYRQRMQVLIDGIAVNDNLYASVPMDSAFPVDLDLVERIEVVRGPSASAYGGDSMFGVINVVTRSGQSVGGGEAVVGLGSGRERLGRISWGGMIGAQTDVLVSVSGNGAHGLDLNYPDRAAAGLDSRAGQVEGQDGGKLFFRARGADWRATLIHSDRKETVTTGSYGTVFNDTNHWEQDRFTLAELAGDWVIDAKNSFHQRVYAGEYLYRGQFPYDYSPDYVINRDYARGRWWGFESRLQSSAWDNQRWTLGLEYRNNFSQYQRNDDVGYGCYGVGNTPCLDSRRSNRLFTVYAQDEARLGTAWTLTAGLRFDRVEGDGNFWSPRLGLVYDAQEKGLFKVLVGSAFRTPTVYERYYTTSSYAYGNQDLKAERMTSIEMGWEKRLTAQARLVSSLYTFRVTDMISTDLGGVASNSRPVRASGAEFEYEGRFGDGIRLRGGYGLQYVAGEGGWMDNSPRHMVKLNLALPTGLAGLSAGVEGQWVSRRLAAAGSAQVGAYGLANLNLRYVPVGRGWEASLGIYNLFDTHYRDPVDTDDLGNFSQWYAPQLGRTFLAKWLIRF